MLQGVSCWNSVGSMKSVRFLTCGSIDALHCAGGRLQVLPARLLLKRSHQVSQCTRVVLRGNRALIFHCRLGGYVSRTRELK